jgi:hypothetical protein
MVPFCTATNYAHICVSLLSINLTNKSKQLKYCYPSLFIKSYATVGLKSENTWTLDLSPLPRRFPLDTYQEANPRRYHSAPP